MRKFTLFLMSLFLMLGTTMAQNYSLTETGISSEELNAKTAPTLIAIKNLSRTNNYYFVGNTGAAPYSAAEFSDAAVFVWQPVEEGVAGSYYLMKLDGTYMQATSPKDFGTVNNAAVFTTTNPTTAGTGSAYFNGDGDSQGYIVDEALLVRFVNAAGTWINVQNGDNGTPMYNDGKGGWTIHHVYAVEEAAVEPEPEPISGLVLELTSEQIGTAPYQLSDEDAAKVFALSDMTVALKVTTPASMNNIRYALFCTSDPTQAANTDAKGTNSAYVAYGTSNQNIGYLASCKTGDRFTSGTIPLATEDVVLVYVISPTNNLFQIYMNGSLVKEWNNAHSDGFMSGYEIATPQMVKADYENANIYIGGGMTAEGTYEVFPGTITGVEVHNGVLSAEEIADIFATTEPEPEVPFEVVAVTPSEAVTELSTITVEFSEEIEGTQDLMAMETIYVGSRTNACNFTVDGKVLTITLWTPITTPGEYALKVPASVGITRASNGEAVVIDGEITFTVKEAVVEPETPTLNETVVFDFTNGEWGIPTMEQNNFSNIKTAGEYTDGAKTINIDPTANGGSYIYDSKGFLQLGKPGSKITLPAFDFAVEKIEVVGHSSATSYPNVDMNVFVGGNAVSTACIGTTATSTFEIAAGNQAAGNVYELVIGSNGGNYSSVMYITYIKVYPADNKLEAPVIDLESGVYVGAQTVNVHSATADLEGVTNVTYYYTTDGNEPTVEDEEAANGEITIENSCTLKVIVELTYGDKTYVIASASAEYIITEAVTYHRAVAVESGNYFLVADGNVAAPIKANGKTLPAKETTVNGDDVTEGAYYALTLEESEYGFNIKDVNGKYIYTSIMNTDRILSGTMPMDSWTITIADDETSAATITSNGLVLVFVDGQFVVAEATAVPENAVYPTFYGVHATGVENIITNGEAIESIFDLNGRKIEKITERGIYIVNGKKVFVK